MGLFKRKLETKASDLALTPALQAILDQGPISFTPDGSIGFFGLFGSSYGQLYKRNSALRAVVDFLSRNIAQCRIRVFKENADGVSLPAPDHPVQALLDHPQQGIPRSRFMRQVVADKAIYDTAAVWKIRESFDNTPRADGTIGNTGRVTNLLRIPVPYVSIWQGSIAAPVTFRLSLGRDSIKVPAADMIWLPGYSPDSNAMGIPPVETLRQVLAEEWAAGKERENFWRNGPQLSGWFSHDPQVPDLTADQLARFREQWKERYGGVGASDAQGVPKMPPGIEFHTDTVDAKNAEYLATRTLAREECCRAYGIQPALLGITAANFASLDMFHQMLYQDTLAPWMVPIQEEFEEQLLAEFESVDSGYHLDFNINAKLQGSFMEQAQIGQRAVGGPWMTPDEFREKWQGLPPLPDGEGAGIITPSNVVRGGGPQANPLDAANQFTKTEQLRLIEGDSA